jgi:hypothetical protein
LAARLKPSGGAVVWNLADLETGSFFRPLSREKRKKGSGPRPHCALCDGRHPDDRLFRRRPAAEQPRRLCQGNRWLGSETTGRLARWLKFRFPTVIIQHAVWVYFRGTDPYARWCGRGGVAEVSLDPDGQSEHGATLLGGAAPRPYSAGYCPLFRLTIGGEVRSLHRVLRR